MQRKAPSSSSEGVTLNKILCSRRDFLKSFSATVALAGISVSDLLYAQAPAASLRYRLRREDNELNLILTAVGFQETSTAGIFGRHRQYWLQPVGNFQRFIFTLPPQYFAETALKEAAIPNSLTDADLSQIQLFPASASQIVLTPRDLQRIELTLDALLKWENFDLVLPDTTANRKLYDIEYKDAANRPTTQVEVPWGIVLSPIEPKANPALGAGTISQRYRWVPSTDPRRGGTSPWSELWSASLEDPSAPAADVPMDVLGVHGFVRLPDQIDPGQHLHVRLQQNFDMPSWLSQDASPGMIGSSLSNLDRIKIAATFSDRFPLDAKTTVDYLPNGSSGAEETRPCYIDGNAIQASQMRVSSRGASVISGAKAQWRPGCILSSWNESIYDGRDQEVEMIQSGWLYPFGIFALLITRTERVFVPDQDRHNVAPLIQQTFIHVPQPNAAVFSSRHLESIFQSLTITSDRTPPLDVIAAGQLDWSARDYFLPLVGGEPFKFRHTGTDWENKPHHSSMPLIFVANGAAVDPTSCLIWEPGANVTSDGGTDTPAQWKIAKHGDGLRVVDKYWNTQTARFAKYGEQIAVAMPMVSGDTTQQVDWVEWTRSIVPDNMNQRFDGSAMHPFQARSRTLQIKLKGPSLFTQMDIRSLATYRDTRFVDAPILDPEPTAAKDIYFCNLISDQASDTPYLYLLENASMLPVVPAGSAVEAIYFGTSDATAQNNVRALLGNIDNEVRLGTTTPSDSIGALATPDTHCTAVNRAHGLLGDSTFNKTRWPQHSGNTNLLQGSSRLDYAAYRLKFRKPIDQEPFDRLRAAEDLSARMHEAREMMGYPIAAPMLVGTHSSPLAKLPAQLKLGDMFGQNAEVIPGLSFAKIFEEIGIDPIPAEMQQANPNTSARPLAWKFQTFGVDWLLSLIGSGSNQMSLDDFLNATKATQPDPSMALHAPIGMKGTLNWETSAFPKEGVRFDDVGVVFERAGNTRIALNAELNVSLGLHIGDGTLSLAPDKPRISANARLEAFSLTIFEFIQVVFSYIEFHVDPDGAKKLDVQIQTVGLTGDLGFIKQLADLFGSLGHGFHLDITPQRAIASLTMRFPSQDGMPLFVGPAQITNLSVAYSVTIPLLDRDALATSFAISSREKPLTIYIPPWYGGKSYFLIETATKGLRMLDVSMEYGGVISAAWGIARGSASLTAGVYYGVDRSITPGTTTFMAFVRAAVDLSILGFIEFKGQIYIGLGVQGNSVYGIAQVSASIRIGFFHFSYSFTATHRDTRHDSGAHFATTNAAAALTTGGANAALSASTISYSGDAQLWQSHPPLQNVASSPPRRDAYLKIIDAYKRRGQ